MKTYFNKKKFVCINCILRPSCIGKSLYTIRAKCNKFENQFQHFDNCKTNPSTRVYHNYCRYIIEILKCPGKVYDTGKKNECIMFF